jgi:translation initiation factor 4E
MAEVINPATTPSLPLDSKQTNEPVNDENAAPSTSAPATNGNNVTVFHDPENFNVKHPLQNQWTLWFTKPPSGKGDNWNDLLKEVVTFDSVEEFWGVYVSSKHPNPLSFN